jgi:MYXO-CTERM domain-containing protein
MKGPSRTDANYDRDRDDHGFNFGWLGLAGLARLLGMRRRDNRVDRVNHYDDPRSIDNTDPGGIR